MEKQEWLDWRKIGSSDAIVIMGSAPREWKINTPYKLWHHKLNQTESEENAAMIRGKVYEEEAISWAEDHLGILLERQKMVEHPDNDFMTATLDAVSFDGDVVVEVKVSELVYRQLANGNVPATYFPQIQHQIEIQQPKRFYLVAYVPGKNGQEAEGICMEVFRDDKYIANMVHKEKLFWDCLKNYTAPPLSAWDYEDREDDLWSQASFEFLMLDKELEHFESLKKKRDEMRDRLIELANGKNARGNGIKLTQSFPKGKIKYEEIPELKLVDLDKYREPSQERWTISKYTG